MLVALDLELLLVWHDNVALRTGTFYNFGGSCLYIAVEVVVEAIKGRIKLFNDLDSLLLQ